MKKFSFAAVAAGSILAAGAIGCGTDDETDVEAGPRSTDVQVIPGSILTSPEWNARLEIVTGAGMKQRGNLFAQNGDVFIAMAPLDATMRVVPRDWMFEVRNGNGALVSTDDFQCRKFHVGFHGTIDRIGVATNNAGADCTHLFTRLQDGTVFVNLMPFANVKSGSDGLMRFSIATAPLAKKFPEKPLDATFTVVTPGETPPCDTPDHDDGTQPE